MSGNVTSPGRPQPAARLRRGPASVGTVAPALEVGMPIRLFPRAAGGWGARTGRVVRFDDDGWVVEVHAPLDGDLQLSPGRTLRCVLQGNDPPCDFWTRVLSVSDNGVVSQVRLARPSSLRPLHRRSPRARLYSSTPVRLRPMQPRGRAVDAALMNVSADGLACRLPASSDVQLVAGCEVWTTFRLEGVESLFELPAVLVYRVPAGTPALDVMGLAFVGAAAMPSDRDRLRTALRTLSLAFD